tara:strand:- start:877 stop:2127 length:1251 start_codon:yes stop_codon:yes gene_type:complete
MSEFYNVTYVHNGIRFTKTSDENVVVELFGGDTPIAMHQLVRRGEIFTIFADVWNENDEILQTKVMVQEFAPDGKLVNIEDVEFNLHSTNIDFSNQPSLLIFLTNGQLGDTINWVPYIMDFLDQRKDLFSFIAIRVKMYEFWLNVFSEYQPTPIRDPNTGNLVNIALLGGKIVLRDIDEDIEENDFDVALGVGLMEDKDYIHPFGVNVSNHLGIELKPFSRLRFEDYYEPLGQSERDNMAVTDKNMWNSTGKHVCIAPYGTMKAKMWISYDCEQDKWQSVVNHLTDLGYEVWWISREKCNLDNVVDLSGDNYSIEDRIRQLLGCEFLVGLSSGLSWLANACGVHVFRIDAWTFDWHGFTENLTSITSNAEGVCRGCWHDTLVEKDFHHDYCPRNMDFICSKSIPSIQVINEIDKYI